MDIFDLYAKINIDSSGYTKGINDASAKFNSFKTGLGSALADIAKMTAAAVTAGAAAVGKIVKDAVANYGEYEQLVGGIETLFKDSADAVKDNADKAFATAQISANQYMDLVTSFSASLIQSTGRGAQTNIDDLKEKQKEALAAQKQLNKDELKAERQKWADKISAADKGSKETLKKQRDAAIDSLQKEQDARITTLQKANKKALEDAQKANSTSTQSAQSLQRAAELSDLAVIDMADNANKMGTNMQSIQNAYQGFAKQNYTMLDNLKLGYGGTKAEMERLLKDADALNAKQGKVTKYSVDSFADIVEAIHVVQQELGITGTSSEEASTTITGSMASVKAAWQDVLTAMGSGKNVSQKLDNFTKSVTKWAQNMKPVIKQAVSGAVEVIGELAPEIANELPGLVAEIAPDLLKAGADIVTNLATGIYNQIARSNFDEDAKKLTEKVNEMISGVDAEAGGEKFANVLNKAINAVFNISSTFDFKECAKKLTDWTNGAITNIEWDKVGQTVSNAWKGAWDFIGTSLANVDWEGVGESISEFINNVDWWGILDSMFTAIGEVIKNAPEFLEGVVKKLDFENAAGLFAMLFAPKMAANLLTYVTTNSTVVGDLQKTGASMANTIGSKLKIAFEAFIVGWEIGTWIYHTFKEEIDEAFEGLMYDLKDATKPVSEYLDQQKENIAANAEWINWAIKEADEKGMEGLRNVAKSYEENFGGSGGGGHFTLSTVGQESERYNQLQQERYSNAYQTVSSGQLGVPTSVLNQQTQIYLDTGKLVGGTGNTRAQQTNYTARGYAT